jgi:hypothetical protein
MAVIQTKEPMFKVNKGGDNAD